MPALPIRTTRIELPDDYAGFWLVLRTNPPMRSYEDLASGELPRIFDALAKMTVDSNLVDDEGAPADLRTVQGWRDMPRDLLFLVADKLTDTMTVSKATGNDSKTPSTPAPESSPASTT